MLLSSHNSFDLRVGENPIFYIPSLLLKWAKNWPILLNICVTKCWQINKFSYENWPYRFCVILMHTKVQPFFFLTLNLDHHGCQKGLHVFCSCKLSIFEKNKMPLTIKAIDTASLILLPQSTPYLLVLYYNYTVLIIEASWINCSS